MEKHCQSCGIPMNPKNGPSMQGTESDGSLSLKWCQLCYDNGEFLGPDCTLPQMLEIADSALRKQGASKFVRFIARRNIPRLERWR